jgi:hypothetical protein
MRRHRFPSALPCLIAIALASAYIPFASSLKIDLALTSGVLIYLFIDNDFSFITSAMNDWIHDVNASHHEASHCNKNSF